MQSIRDVMTTNPQTLSSDSTVMQAAQTMRDQGIGDVIVADGGTLRGIVTDRDITIRSVAEGMDAQTTTLGEICSVDLTTVTPDMSLTDAVTTMRTSAVRRLPVMEGSQIVGVVSLGDLAMERDEQSALKDISAAPANS